MATIARVQAVWSGWSGGPGVSSFYCVPGESDELFPAVADFFTAIRAVIPDDVTVTVDPTVESFDDATGTMVAAVSVAPSTPVVGQSEFTWSASQGACITWRTSTVVDGRKLRGRTFLVPLAANAFDSTGKIPTSIMTLLMNAAGGLNDATTTGLLVWHRPVSGAGGSSAPVTSWTINNRGAVLRSRRD